MRRSGERQIPRSYLSVSWHARQRAEAHSVVRRFTVKSFLLIIIDNTLPLPANTAHDQSKASNCSPITACILISDLKSALASGTFLFSPPCQNPSPNPSPPPKTHARNVPRNGLRLHPQPSKLLNSKHFSLNPTAISLSLLPTPPNPVVLHRFQR